MKIATKNTLSLISVYLVFVIATGIWLEHELRSTVRDMMQETSEIIGQEIRYAIFEPLTDYLGKRRNVDKKELEKIIIEAADKSEMLVSIDIVTPDGEIVLSSKENHIGTQWKIPAHLFTEDTSPKLLSQFDTIFDAGIHTLWAPVTKDGVDLGYVRLALHGRDVAKLFQGIYRSLMVSALIGLIVILALGLMLQLELGRITNGLASLLEAAMRGEVDSIPKHRDEFSTIRSTATRLGNEIKAVKTKADLARLELGAVANHLKVGVVLLDKENRLDFINDRAKVLLSSHIDIERYSECWDSARTTLDSAIDEFRNGGKLTHVVTFTIDDKEKSKRIHAEFYRIDNKEWQGCVILLNDQDFIDALNDDLQSAARLRALSRLLLGAIHDIKAPINAITMNLELLIDSLKDNNAKRVSTASELDEPLLNYTTIIKTELERLNQLISGLYTQTLGEDRGRSNVNLGRIVEELCNLLRPQCKAQKIDLKFEQPDTPVTFFGIPGQIKQATLNLLLNAIEVMAEGGSLIINLSADRSTAKLRICDNGPGIPSSLVDRIFDMHFTTKSTGTGIGLYVSRTIIESHGGDVSVETEFGRGACFEINLPLVQK